MKKILGYIKEGWQCFKDLARSPMFCYGFPLMAFALLGLLKGSPLAVGFCALWILVITVNTDED